MVEAANPQAFAILYDRHCRTAYWLACRITGRKQTAEEMVQDAFLNVWRRAGTYRAERGSARTWILSIVKNRSLDQLRTAASLGKAQDRVEASTPKYEPSEAFAESWRNFQRERVREALETLPYEQREAITLAHFSGYTHTEIAERLGLPLGTVKGRIRIGIKKLGKHLGDRRLMPMVNADR